MAKKYSKIYNFPRSNAEDNAYNVVCCSKMCLEHGVFGFQTLQTSFLLSKLMQSDHDVISGSCQPAPRAGWTQPWQQPPSHTHVSTNALEIGTGQCFRPELQFKV